MNEQYSSRSFYFLHSLSSFSLINICVCEYVFFPRYKSRRYGRCQKGYHGVVASRCEKMMEFLMRRKENRTSLNTATALL